ncbi:MAG: hypothetical protein E6P95_03745 [Candidatus Moraniibacteriota bacterium]|nr:MAG: hypothetical protein E6P95_03745 [Candidatus Moranbacteria bacterium]
MKSPFAKKSQSPAYVLIITVLGLLAFSLTLIMTLSQFSLGMLESAETVRSSMQAFTIAEGCVEGILNELRSDPSYAEGSYSTAAGICNLDLRQNEEDPTLYELAVTAEDGSVTRGVRVSVRRTDAGIYLLSWLED